MVSDFAKAIIKPMLTPVSQVVLPSIKKRDKKLRKQRSKQLGGGG